MYNEDDIQTVKEICKRLNDSVEITDDLKKDLTKLQLINNKWYSNNGLTSKVLELQVLINQFRHQYNVHDESEVLLFDEDKPFVQ